jgi:hypothetical protein
MIAPVKLLLLVGAFVCLAFATWRLDQRAAYVGEALFIASFIF